MLTTDHIYISCQMLSKVLAAVWIHARPWIFPKNIFSTSEKIINRRWYQSTTSGYQEVFRIGQTTAFAKNVWSSKVHSALIGRRNHQVLKHFLQNNSLTWAHFHRLSYLFLDSFIHYGDLYSAFIYSLHSLHIDYSAGLLSVFMLCAICYSNIFGNH